ncbi:thiol:disulfide interchange protein DsbA/DsbL [Rugamonas sp. CCM 8940]|uniref:thiol:disulfide interchange protein DsbA/DsbL n=1 Tax=Rugamonas sp. CCM 8940 TaxID=2765359 RepID=UPI0018F6E667|nr:thiol:disulfide interchange protein DsbA/DsbL [Rugamonas sp. CCM 8940]MBJ7314207.1 thiol:disulfide interchange protein DsbA/DsbL [Rugamonas sp. CCM 8940]
MRTLKHLLGALALSTLAFVATAAAAAPAAPKAGVEYQVLPAPQPTEAGKKIEITEFFAYYCPHCHAFEPALAAWLKKHGDNVVFKRVHISRDDSVLPQQKLFYTLEAMGLLSEQMHNKIFDEMHVAHNRLNRDEQIFDFVAKQGVDKQKFVDTYRSFGVAGRVRKASAMMDAYKVDSWPMLAIDGRFITSPSMADEGSKAAATEAQLHTEALQVMDVLLAKAKAEKK